MIHSHEPLPVSPSRRIYRAPSAPVGYVRYVLEEGERMVLELTIGVPESGALGDLEQHLWLLFDAIPRRRGLALMR